MRHRVLTILVIFALLGVIYCSWAFHRTSFSVLIGDSQFPRPWPFPDQGLVALNHWYDARNPPPPDALKLHGEWIRVRATVGLALVSFLWVLALSSVRIGVLGWLRLAANR